MPSEPPRHRKIGVKWDEKTNYKVSEVDKEKYNMYILCIYEWSGKMIAKLIKSGNSLAVRIPRAFAKDVGLEEKSVVEMRLEKGKLILTPEKVHYDLKDLVSMITEENIHHEVDFGSPVGNEVW